MDISPAVFAALLTASGAVIGAGIIQTAIQFLKSVGLGFIDGREKLASLVGSIILVVLAVMVGISQVPPTYATATLSDILIVTIASVLAVFNITRLSMSLYDDVKKQDSRTAITNSAGWKRDGVE